MRCRSPPHLLSTAGAPRAPNSLLVGQRTSALPGASHVGPDASLRAPSPPRPPGDALGWYRCGMEQRSPRLFACRPDPGRPRSAHGAAALVGLRASRRRGVPRGPRSGRAPVCGCCFTHPSHLWQSEPAAGVALLAHPGGSGFGDAPEPSPQPLQPRLPLPFFGSGAQLLLASFGYHRFCRCCVGRALPRRLRRAVPAAVPGAEPGMYLQGCCQSWASALLRAIPFLFYFSFCYNSHNLERKTQGEGRTWALARGARPDPPAWRESVLLSHGNGPSPADACAAFFD